MIQKDFALPADAAQCAPQRAGETPLCVDLDGTLILTDVLWESVLLLAAQNPLCLLLIPVWLMKGRAYLKREIARRVELDPRSLPYNQEFLTYLRAEKSSGRVLILVTASDLKLAEPIAEHLGLFSEVMASSGGENLKGARKREALTRRFGERGYDYAGNSRADIAVWTGCRRAVVVNASARVRAAAGSVTTVETAFAPRRAGLSVYLRAIRAYQWVKNLLVFLPVLTSHQLFDLDPMKRAFFALIAFSLCASSVYLLNDLLDLQSDRLHSTKRKRPFAAGRLSIPAGLVLVVVLLAGSAATSLLLPWQFQVILAIYYALTLSYSLSLKRKVLVDIFVLGGLYAIRVLAGSAATGITPSPWLLAFCLFFFLNLALVKRFIELRDKKEEHAAPVAGRGYYAGDLQPIGSFGTGSGFMSVLALYINSPQVIPLYRSPSILWFLCPLLLYWISRVWLLAYRGKLHSDPVLFTLRDKVSYLTALCGGVILTLAAHGLHFLSR